jgi:hypothetical protein
VKDRVRNLIADSHWPSDGRYKEEVLQSVIERHLPKNFNIGSGFVSFPKKFGNDYDTSHQTDIIIYESAKPVLFKGSQFVVVTPDTVQCLIEVKTKFSSGEMESVIEKLSRDIAEIRNDRRSEVFTGVYFYNSNVADKEELGKTILELLQQKIGDDQNNVINFVSVGDSNFIRFWAEQDQVHGQRDSQVWHSYVLPDKLAPAYFIDNVIWELSYEGEFSKQKMWFPAEGGKESYRSHYAKLGENEILRF